ncbi:MAG: ATP-dependent helicase [Candidatus Diapherotrites archaeon]|nr:ATP-dependent helicase [Candidatus Diapherotrites archaeon]
MIQRLKRPRDSSEVFDLLDPHVKAWFESKFKDFTPAQRFAIPEIHSGNNVLISSPTGSGKTLSAFLAIINELVVLGKRKKLKNKVYCIYNSPLKALNNDIKRNLDEPLREITELVKKDFPEFQEIRVGVRTGDTTPKERVKQSKKPPHIFITTPESLAIMLNSPKLVERLRETKYVLIDEIHSLCENKRGTHLAVSLERLEYGAVTEHITRVGLSATIAPLDEVGEFLVGPSRDCWIADVNSSKDIEISVVSPVDDMIYTPSDVVNRKLYKMLHKMIQEHKTTIVFTNTRSGTERVVHNLKEKFSKFYNDDNLGAHHSSLGRETRFEVEEKLKNGELKCCVTSTSLELGVDIGNVDLVILLSSPKSVNRALQRIGRSGHRLHDISKGVIIVLDRDDLVECSVLAYCARNGLLDKVWIPRNSLDVLAQHLVGMSIEKEWGVSEALFVLRKAFPYKDLTMKDLVSVLRYLNGEYVDLSDRSVYGKIWFDEGKGLFRKRGRMIRPIYYLNIGTIPDSQHARVYLRGNEKRLIGTLDEQFLQRLKKGDLFVLGGKLYRFAYARGMSVSVDRSFAPAPTVPSWYSEQLPLSFDLALKIGEFRRQVKDQLEAGTPRKQVISTLQEKLKLDKKTATAIFNYFYEQFKFMAIPHDKRIIVETFINSEGKQFMLFHSLFGRRVNDALSRYFAFLLSREKKINIGILINDNGFVLQIPSNRKVSLIDLREMINIETVSKDLSDSLENTELFKRRFRHVAGRALLILRNYMGRSKTVGRQQLNAHILYHTIKKLDKEFPVIRETYREIMEDSMDLKNTLKVLTQIKNKELHLAPMDKRALPSPFAHVLVTAGYADIMMIKDKKVLLQYLHQEVLREIGELPESTQGLRSGSVDGVLYA